MIRHATADDSGQICDIYNHYISETPITFEEQPVAPEDMVQRIAGRRYRVCPGLFGRRNSSCSGTPLQASGKAGVPIATPSRPRSICTLIRLENGSALNSTVRC